MHRITAALAALLLLIAGAACGDDDGEAGLDTTTTEAPGSTSTTEADTTTTAPTDDTEPVGELTTEPKESEGFPELSGETALLSDVELGLHEGFTRVVWTFESGDPPNHRVELIEPPVRQDGSGNEVDVAGSAFVEVRLTPAAGFDPLSDDARETYTGPDRVQAPSGSTVTEVVRTGDFEGQLAWVIGLEEEAPFAVTTLEDPLRVVVDIAAR